GDEETRHRPHRLVVRRLEGAGARQAGIIAAPTESDPAHGALAIVRQQSRRLARIDDLLHAALVAGALPRPIVLPLQPPPHAPASAARAARTEQLGEIVPALGRQRRETKLCHHASISALALSNTASNMARVSLPVCVFCWLGWYEPRRAGRSGATRAVAP